MSAGRWEPGEWPDFASPGPCSREEQVAAAARPICESEPDERGND